MTRDQISGIAAAAIVAATGLSMACNRNKEPQPPAAQVQTQTPLQTVDTPETVTGCLRSGDGPDTFVLTTTKAADGTAPVTYQLIAGSGVNLRDHIGEPVSVTGTVRQQQSTTTASAPAAADDKTRGTSGSEPTVQTSATLQVRRLEVTAINRTQGECEK